MVARATGSWLRGHGSRHDVSNMLTIRDRQHIVDRMSGAQFVHVMDTLATNVRDLLGSPDPCVRVHAIRHVAAGVEALEREVLLDAQASGMSWADIGGVYGVSRQAVHRRFSDETVVPSDFFDELLKDLDEKAEVVPALAQAAKRRQPAPQPH